MAQCAVCCGEKPDNYYRACEKCRASWRKAKSNTKEYWLLFMKDRLTGETVVTVHGHNCIGDFRGNSYFLGMKHVKVNMENLQK